MLFRTKSASLKRSKNVRTAQAFYPKHEYHEEYKRDRLSDAGVSLSDRQNYLIDLVMQNSPQVREQAVSPLMSIIMQPNPLGKSFVSASDKKLLLNIWQSANLSHDESSKVVVSGDYPERDLDRLRSSGLMAGRELTKKGKELLVKLMLDEDLPVEKVASGMGKLVKMANMEIDGPTPGTKIKKDKNNRWKVVEVAPPQNLDNVSQMSTASLNTVLKLIQKAKKDSLNVKLASVVNDNCDMNRLMHYEKTIKRVLRERAANEQA